MFRAVWSMSLRAYRGPILGWGLGLGFIMAITFATATPALDAAFAPLAPSFRFFGDPIVIATPQGYVTWKVLDLFLPAILSIWFILAGARMTRGEEERGVMDVVLSTPLSRARIIAEKLLALMIATLAIGALIALGTITGEPVVGVPVDIGAALLASLNVCLLAFLYGMVALLISQFTRGRAASGLASSLMVLGFVLDGASRVLDGSWIRSLSPFYYYNLNRPLLPTFTDTPVAALILVGASLLFAFVAAIIFIRRDSGRPAWSWARSQPDGRQPRGLAAAHRDVWLRAVWLRGLRAQAWSAAWWFLGIGAFCGWMTLLIPSIEKPLRNALTQSPTIDMILTSVAHNASRLGAITFVYGMALVVIFALSLALTWSADIDAGRLELVLGVPRSRPRILLERFAAITVLTVLACIMTWLSVVVAARIAAVNVDQGHVLAASISLLPPALVIMAVVHALAGRLPSSTVLGLVTAYLVLAYVADLLQSLFNLPNWVLSLSVIHLYGSPIADGMNWANFLGMTAVALAMLAIAVVQFRQADMSGAP